MRGKSDIDLDAGDLPPDLVFEADVTNSSLDKLPIYARLGVQEVWCYAGGGMEILLLNEAGEGYVPGAGSCFPYRRTCSPAPSRGDLPAVARPGCAQCARGRAVRRTSPNTP